MPVSSLPIPAVASGNVLTSTNWNAIVKDNLNKLLNTGHRTLTVAQFGALTGLEGTKGVVAGDEVYLEVDATNGVLWHLVYESTEATYKWRFLGGRPMNAIVDTSEATGSAGAYVDLATVGPSITVPRGGDYDAEYGSYAQVDGTTNSTTRMSIAVGATAAVDADSVQLLLSAGGMQASIGRMRRKTGLAANDVVKAKYKSAGTTNNLFANRWLSVRPVRIV